MRLRVADCVFIILFPASCVGVVFGAPTDFKLLPLIPPGAQIVSGFENRPDRTSGLLLLTTHNNVLDLDDWRSLSGVDPKRSFSEVIEVTIAPSGKSLNEHMLLAAGKFHHDCIFSSAELNGAKSAKYLGQTVFLIEPFSREKTEMKDTRWLTILDDRIAIFGTAWMVQQAVNRFENRVPPDPILMARLALFHRDVSSWNVLTSMPNLRQSVFLQPGGPFSTLFKDAELMLVGIHVDSRVRVDLLMRVKKEDVAIDPNQKAAQFSQVFAQGIVRDDDRMPQLKNVQVENNRIQASVVLSSDDFMLWKNGQMSRDRSLIDGALRKAKNEMP